MPALNFQKQFAPAVEEGNKRQTIRARRKRPIVPGDVLHLYTGMRTASCRKLRETRCQDVLRVVLSREFAMIDGEYLIDRESFAERDGFDSYAAMLAWFEKVHGLPFRGDLIRW
jgi:hypothetical protein